MTSDLESYGVSVVALSKDTTEEAAVHKERDALGLMLLSDPKLEVIRQYGVEHHKAFGFHTTGFIFFGIPLDVRPSFQTMAIPTSLLVDEEGTIVWIDQSDDYRLRSDNSLVFDAVRSAFPTAS